MAAEARAYRDHHATIFVDPETARGIEAVRRAWDPVMAAQIAAHVTVAYPAEAPIADLLLERVRTAAAVTAPFRLRLGSMACYERPEDGVYVGVEDVDGGYAGLREAVLRPPFRRAAVIPHLTLVHPRTSGRGRELWESGTGRRQDGEFTAREVAITGFDGARWVVLWTFTLGGGP